MPTGKQPTLADLRTQRAAQQDKLAARQVERESLEEQIPMLVAAHFGEGIGAPVERERLKKLAEEIRTLETAIAALSSRIEQAEVIERDAKHAEMAELAANAGRGCEKRAAALQAGIDEVCKLALSFQDADAQFVAAVNDLPKGFRSDDFSPREMSVNLSQLVALRLHVMSGARIPARGVFESAFELKQRGTADLVKRTANYVGVALKKAPQARVEPTSPGAA